MQESTSINSTLQQTSDVLTGEKHCFYITEKKKKFFRQKEIKHAFSIPAMNLFTMIRISKEVLSIEKEFDGSFHHVSMQAISKHSEALIRIIAYAVLNDDRKPGPGLLKIISLLNANELLDVVAVIIKQMNLKPFMTSIISISGVNVLEVNPKEQRS